MEILLKVLLKARLIPISATVTRKNGEKEYELVDHMRIFTNGIEGIPKEVKAEGVMFLRPRNGEGDYSAITSETELLWQVTPEYLRVWLDEGKHT